MKRAWFLMEAAKERFLPQRPNLASLSHSPPLLVSAQFSLCPGSWLRLGGVAEEGPLLSPGIELWRPGCSPTQLALAPSLLLPCLAPWLQARWRHLALTHF